MEVFQAGLEDLEAVAEVFDHYRVFYKASSDLEGAREFIRERMQNCDSVIFAARHDGCIVGLTQLYPSFSSVSMRRIWILNDLFVDLSYRKQGVATLLMQAAKDFATETKALQLELATHHTNTTAQSLYATLGYVKDEAFYYYALSLEGEDL